MKVAFVPGSAFYVGEGGTNTMRLNFSNATPERIQERIARLGQLLQTLPEMNTILSPVSQIEADSLI